MPHATLYLFPWQNPKKCCFVSIQRIIFLKNCYTRSVQRMNRYVKSPLWISICHKIQKITLCCHMKTLMTLNGDAEQRFWWSSFKKWSHAIQIFHILICVLYWTGEAEHAFNSKDIGSHLKASCGICNKQKRDGLRSARLSATIPGTSSMIIISTLRYSVAFTNWDKALIPWKTT